MDIKINPFSLSKVLLVLAILGYGLFQIYITQDQKFLEVEATLIEAYSETYSSYSQGTRKTKTRSHFQYSYNYEGLDFTSERYSHVSPNSALGVEQFKGVKEGTKFSVYVHPTFNSYAVVQKGPPYFFIYTFVLTGIFGLFNCIFESWLEQLLKAKVVKDKKRLERIRSFFKLTGASTAIGIFASTILFFFAI